MALRLQTSNKAEYPNSFCLETNLKSLVQKDVMLFGMRFHLLRLFFSFLLQKNIFMFHCRTDKDQKSFK